MKKVIMVTGASSGIGKATAKQLIKEGHIVYGVARRIEKMQDLTELGGYSIAMDITNEEQIQAAVEQIINEQGRIDVLVNNAGYAEYGPVEQVSMDDARRQFEVNIFGLASLTQKVIPFMRQRKSGTIINVSSVGGKIYTPFGAWYHATKHALEGWSDSLRLEMKPFGVDVVIVQPGAIKTEFGDVMYQPMMDRAMGSAYEKTAVALADATMGAYERPGAASHPDVIAEVISEAIEARRPKTRYVAGKMAKMVLFMRRLLSDRGFDRMIMSQLKRWQKNGQDTKKAVATATS